MACAVLKPRAGSTDLGEAVVVVLEGGAGALVDDGWVVVGDGVASRWSSQAARRSTPVSRNVRRTPPSWRLGVLAFRPVFACLGNGADQSGGAAPASPFGALGPVVRRPILPEMAWTSAGFSALRPTVATVDELQICFTETEVAQILWVLSEAAELADTADTLSTLALIEETLRMVRDRFDRRQPE